jgi:hypothetical protein
MAFEIVHHFPKRTEENSEASIDIDTLLPGSEVHDGK